MTNTELDTLEQVAIGVLVEAAAKGNVALAGQALQAIDRMRKKMLSAVHEERMRSLADQPEAMVQYLATLGLTVAQIEERLGRRLKPGEKTAYARGENERLLEVRAIELERMRRGEGEIPGWATRKHGA